MSVNWPKEYSGRSGLPPSNEWMSWREHIRPIADCIYPGDQKAYKRVKRVIRYAIRTGKIPSKEDKVRPFEFWMLVHKKYPIYQLPFHSSWLRKQVCVAHIATYDIGCPYDEKFGKLFEAVASAENKVELAGC